MVVSPPPLQVTLFGKLRVPQHAAFRSACSHAAVLARAYTTRPKMSGHPRMSRDPNLCIPPWKPRASKQDCKILCGPRRGLSPPGSLCGSAAPVRRLTLEGLSKLQIKPKIKGTATFLSTPMALIDPRPTSRRLPVCRLQSVGTDPTRDAFRQVCVSVMPLHIKNQHCEMTVATDVGRIMACGPEAAQATPRCGHATSHYWSV